MALTEETAPQIEEKPVAKPKNKPPRPRFGRILLGFLTLLILAGLGGLGFWAAQNGIEDEKGTAQKIEATPGSSLAGSTRAAGSAPLQQVYDLVADPADYQLLYAATSNGLKRSKDSGQTWTEMEGAELKNQSITALSFDSEDPERPLYAATPANGLFKTTDDGKTWANLGLKSRNISAVAAYRGAVYVGVNGPFAGVYRSNDSGKTFLPADSGNLPAEMDIRTIAIDPDNGLNIYIGTGFTPGRRTLDYGRVKVSRDGGRNWKDLGNWETGNPKSPDPLSPITVLLHAPGDRVYAGDGNRLFRLSADRSVWQSPGTGLPDGVYAIASDPQIPGMVYAAAKDGFYRNTGGQDWQKLGDGKAAPIFNAASGSFKTFPALVPINTHNNAFSVNSLNSTYIYSLNPQGSLISYENRDFGKNVVAPIPGFKEPDFSPYNGVNPAAAVDPPDPNSPPDPGKTYFSATKHYLSGGFKTYWDKNGGLAAFGYPLTEEFSEFIATQNVTRTVQYFERVRLEFDSSAKPGQEVSVGLLGRDAVALKYYVPGRFIPNSKDQAYFPQTRHTLLLGFYQFWDRNNGLARFGYPLSEEVDEKNVTDGKTGTVQYFERVKLEFNKDSKQVQIGNLGREMLIKRGWIKP